jgi:hypothetical protein
MKKLWKIFKHRNYKSRPKAPMSTMTLEQSFSIVEMVADALAAKEPNDLHFHPLRRLQGYDIIHIDLALKLRLANDYLIFSKKLDFDSKYAKSVKMYGEINWGILTIFTDDDKFDHLISLTGTPEYRRYIIELFPDNYDLETNKFKDDRINHLETMDSFGNFCKVIGFERPDFWIQVYRRIGLEYTSEAPQGNIPFRRRQSQDKEFNV